MQQLLTTDDVAERLHISRDSVVKLLNTERLGGAKIGNHWFVTPDDVKLYQQSNLQIRGRKPRKQQKRKGA